MVTQNTQNTTPPITVDHTIPPLVDHTYYPYPYAPNLPTPFQLGGLMGWICPKCNKGISPFQTTCPCSNTSSVKVTCATLGDKSNV